MDLEAYVAAHRHDWNELETLVRQRRLDAGESDRLLQLYAVVGTQLSVIRAVSPDPSLVAQLSLLLARARHRSAPAPRNKWVALRDFFVVDFPATVWRMRWWVLVSVLANVGVMVLLGWWLGAHPEVESTLLTPDQVERLVNVDFEHYYSESAAADFALKVWTNNAWVAAQVIALGVLGLPVIYICWMNAQNTALVGSVMIHHGRGGLFFGLLLPHGMLEMTAVFVAAGVGMRLFWAWVSPGDRTRSQSLAHEGRSAMTVVCGLAAVLAVCGLLEAFVTPSGLPWYVRVGVGVLAEAAFIGYVVVFGRRAEAVGRDGDLAEELDRGHSELTRA